MSPSPAAPRASPRQRVPRLLDRRALGRATLARQHLLERTDRGVEETLEHLVGLQAQTPQTWYVGMWGRLHGFAAVELSDLLERRAAVRLGLMRSTIHLVTTADALTLRPLFDAVLRRTTQGSFGRHLGGVDRAAVAAAGRAVLEDQPMLFGELGQALAESFPGRDPQALAMVVRAEVPLVQVTPRGLWGRPGRAAHTPLESWVGRSLGPAVSVDDLVRRYLGAFGPATVADAQNWSGLTRLGEVVERLRPDLVVVSDPEGRELYDLPDAPRPPPDVPAPVRLLYDYDNLLLAHADRSRVVTDSYRRQVLPDNVMPRLVLVDGVTAGFWTATHRRGTAVLDLQPFDPWPTDAVEQAQSEAAELLRFLHPRATTYDVRLLPPA